MQIGHRECPGRPEILVPRITPDPFAGFVSGCFGANLVRNRCFGRGAPQIQIFERLAERLHVAVRIDEAGQDGCSAGVYDLGFWPDIRRDVAPDGKNYAVSHCDCGGSGLRPG